MAQICFDTYIFLTLIILITVFVVYFYLSIRNIEPKVVTVTKEVPKEVIKYVGKENKMDPITKVDYLKLYDPFTEPDRRPEREQIPPDYVAQHMYISTRGFPENYQVVGTLIKENGNHVPLEEKILRLFGRQTYPRSDEYEYYTTLPDTGIKITIDNRNNKELFDDDTVHIPELKSSYKVKMYKKLDPPYNPYVY